MHRSEIRYISDEDWKPQEWEAQHLPYRTNQGEGGTSETNLSRLSANNKVHSLWRIARKGREKENWSKRQDDSALVVPMLTQLTKDARVHHAQGRTGKMHANISRAEVDRASYIMPSNRGSESTLEGLQQTGNQQRNR